MSSGITENRAREGRHTARSRVKGQGLGFCACCSQDDGNKILYNNMAKPRQVSTLSGYTNNGTQEHRQVRCME